MSVDPYPKRATDKGENPGYWTNTLRTPRSARASPRDSARPTSARIMHQIRLAQSRTGVRSGSTPRKAVPPLSPRSIRSTSGKQSGRVVRPASASSRRSASAGYGQSRPLSARRSAKAVVSGESGEVYYTAPGGEVYQPSGEYVKDTGVEISGDALRQPTPTRGEYAARPSGGSGSGSGRGRVGAPGGARVPHLNLSGSGSGSGGGGGGGSSEPKRFTFQPPSPICAAETASVDSAGYRRVGDQCICEICVCGNHSCPIHPKPLAGDTKFEGASEARDAYPAHALQNTARKVKPRDNGIGYGEGAFRPDTEARQQYPWQDPPPAVPRPREKYEPSGLKFTGRTTAGETYTKLPIEPRKPYAPTPRSSAGIIPFSGKTEAQQSFTGERLKSPDYKREPEPTLTSQPFKGTSENHREFPKWDLPEKEKPKPRAAYKSTPFTGTTEYGDGLGSYTVAEECPVAVIIRSGIDPAYPRPDGPPSKDVVSASARGHPQRHRFRRIDTKGHHLFQVSTK